MFTEVRSKQVTYSSIDHEMGRLDARNDFLFCDWLKYLGRMC